MNKVDRYMSRLNERLMTCAQRTLDELGYTLDEMEQIAEQYPAREDIRACIDEIKEKSKRAATESWATANHWSEHFDGLSGGVEEDKPKEEEPKQEEANDGADDEE